MADMWADLYEVNGSKWAKRLPALMTATSASKPIEDLEHRFEAEHPH